MVSGGEPAGGSAVNEVLLLARLHAAAPGPAAPTGVVAGWYVRKAAVHELLAAGAGDRGDRAGLACERWCAELAVAHADRLRAWGSAGVEGVAA